MGSSPPAAQRTRDQDQGDRRDPKAKDRVKPWSSRPWEGGGAFFFFFSPAIAEGLAQTPLSWD